MQGLDHASKSVTAQRCGIRPFTVRMPAMFGETHFNSLGTLEIFLSVEIILTRRYRPRELVVFKDIMSRQNTIKGQKQIERMYDIVTKFTFFLVRYSIHYCSQ